jgi:hypothetical protein
MPRSMLDTWQRTRSLERQRIGNRQQRWSGRSAVESQMSVYRFSRCSLTTWSGSELVISVAIFQI